MATENNSVASLLLAMERGTSPSLSSFLLSPVLSLFISSSPCSLSPSLLASCHFSRDGNFSCLSFFRRPSYSLSRPFPFFFRLPSRFSLVVHRFFHHPSSFIAWRITLRPGVLRDQEREERREMRENEIKSFFLFAGFASLTRGLIGVILTQSGLTGILKERGHEINNEKCSRLKLRYLPILMELRAEISWA